MVHWAMWLFVEISWKGSRKAGAEASAAVGSRPGKKGVIQSWGLPAGKRTPKARLDEKVSQKNGSGDRPSTCSSCSKGAQRAQELVRPDATLGEFSLIGGALPSLLTTMSSAVAAS